MEATLAKLVTSRVMAEVAIGGWRMSDDESYLDPCPGEIVVFEDFYWCRFGNLCHPFLHKLCDYYRISICNLHPNSVLSVSIFIALCESFLSIQPHFNLWRHFFCLKNKGGAGGSKVAGEAYLNLRDGMKAEYLNVPLSSLMRDYWYKKWFYVQQEQEPKMVQVKELLGMVDRSHLDRPTIALNFICTQVQPCKERVHPLYEYSGSGDPTRESAKNLSREEVNRWLAQLFNLTGYRHLSSMMKAYKLTTPPPRVCLKSPPVSMLMFIVTGPQP
jgi:hypothetical protein